MLSDKRIAVAILNYNGLNLLKKFLPSVVKYSDKKLSNIYIIDNGSDDKSITYVKNKFSEVKIIQNDNNYGYAGGYNKGLSKIDYDYYVLLNNDVEVSYPIDKVKVALISYCISHKIIHETVTSY